MRDRLGELWENIPLWPVVLVALVILTGLYFGMQALHVPTWGIYLTIGGLVAGAIAAGLRRIVGG